eukprot:scaffold72527_cov28-Tisochrysis_lutea.AAC.1
MAWVGEPTWHRSLSFCIGVRMASFSVASLPRGDGRQRCPRWLAIRALPVHRARINLVRDDMKIVLALGPSPAVTQDFSGVAEAKRIVGRGQQQRARSDAARKGGRIGRFKRLRRRIVA